ncbi:MAG: hypothetical protein HY873_11700 [Chloroflexi bacterium]|nr:hypothetical protein [Chloroflexota bacterium]
MLQDMVADFVREDILEHESPQGLGGPLDHTALNHRTGRSKTRTLARRKLQTEPPW